MELIILHYVLHYVFIGATLALPLITATEASEKTSPVTPKEVLLTIFAWPWLWVLLIEMFIKFLIRKL
jgi:ABC-type iron transport system FetAB permease component